MCDFEWIELWMLNELVCDHCSLSSLIVAPQENSNCRGYWAFPDAVAIAACPEAKMDALNHCVNQGFINIVKAAWFSQVSFENDGLEVAQVTIDRETQLDEYRANLTLKGHEKWESEFMPDWNRYWIHSGFEESDDGQTETVSLHYASDAVLGDILQWFPALFDYDSAFGMRWLETYTFPQYQVTIWKSLPWVKYSTWKVRSNQRRLNELIRAKAIGIAPDDHLAKAAGRVMIRDFLQANWELAEKAANVLRRLSKRWE